MLPLSKLLKVGLPVATATTAAIITAYLIALQNNDSKKLNEEDQLLENIEAKTQEFKEEKIKQSEEQEKAESEGPDKSSEKNKEEGQKDKNPIEKKEEKEPNIDNPDKAVEEIVQKALDAMSNQTGAKEVDQMKIREEDIIQPQSQPKELGPQGSNSGEAEKPAQDDQKEEEIASPSAPKKEEEQGIKGKEEMPNENEEKNGIEEPSAQEPLDYEEAAGAVEEGLNSTEPQQTENDREKSQPLDDVVPSKEETRATTEDQGQTEVAQAIEKEHSQTDEGRKSDQGEDGSSSSKESAGGETDNSDGNAETDNLDIEKMKSLLNSLDTHKDSLGALLARFSS